MLRPNGPGPNAPSGPYGPPWVLIGQVLMAPMRRNWPTPSGHPGPNGPGPDAPPGGVISIHHLHLPSYSPTDSW